MSNSGERKVHFGKPGDDGFWPDDPGSILPETYGNFPQVYLGALFEAIAGTIAVRDEVLNLPPQIRRKAEKIDVGLDGKLHARPATPSERGGGLTLVYKSTRHPRTHHKASYPVKFPLP